MQPIDLLVLTGMPLAEPLLAEIVAADPRVRARVFSGRDLAALRAGAEGEPQTAALAAALAEAEIICSVYAGTPDLMQRTPRLRWFHTFAAGIDQYVRWGYLEREIAFTNGSGPTVIPIAEYVLMTLLVLAKSAAGYVRQQQDGVWQRLPGQELRGKTVGIVGLGQIGSEAARLAKAFGCRVIGSRRSATEAREDVDGVDLLLPPGELPRLLAESDFVVLAAPATPETAALINAETLRRMKRTAFVINIARGSLVDEAALLDAIKSETIAGAALDVFEPEPLPDQSELWRTPQVLVTPHISNASEHSSRRHVDLFLDNLQRYLAGEPLRNLVPSERGY